MTQRDPGRRPASWKALAADLAALDTGSERLRADTDRARRASGERTRGSSGERTRSASGGRARATASAPSSPGVRSVPVTALVVLALSVGAAAGALVALLGR